MTNAARKKILSGFFWGEDGFILTGYLSHNQWNSFTTK